jgi:hypothetical protein
VDGGITLGAAYAGGFAGGSLYSVHDGIVPFDSLIGASTGSEGYTYSLFGKRAKVGTRTFLRAGAGVTAGVLDDGIAVYTPGVSE